MSAPVGILALQGAVGPHADALADLGHTAVEVRTPRDLARVHALVVPGGESTTISRLLATSGLADPLAERLAEGMPAFGTCAGMIVLASSSVSDGRPGQRGYGAVDVAVRRNAFGRQVDSFEVPVAVAGLDLPFPAVFIRAPFVEAAGEGVEVLASVEGHPVVCRQGPVLVSAFHPELTADRRLHQLFLSIVAGVS